MIRQIPMALGNDNFWGYACLLIVKYQVRWIEGDEGHVMNEFVGQPRWRTKVRVQCFSFAMPL